MQAAAAHPPFQIVVFDIERRQRFERLNVRPQLLELVGAQIQLLQRCGERRLCKGAGNGRDFVDAQQQCAKVGQSEHSGRKLGQTVLTQV